MNSPDKYDLSKGGHVRIRRTFFREKYGARLGTSTAYVFLVLVDAADTNTSESFLAAKEIAELCDLSEKQVKESLSRLETFGFIHVMQRGSRGRCHATSHCLILSEDSWQFPPSKQSRKDKGSSRKETPSKTQEENRNNIPILPSENRNNIPENRNNIPILPSENRNNIPVPIHYIENYIISEDCNENSSSSSKSSSSCNEQQKTEEEEGTDSCFDQDSFSSLLSPKEIAEIESVFLLGVDEVKGFLIRNKTSFSELSKCLQAIAAKDMNGSNVRYVDFQGRPIQRPLGFIFKNGWITAGRACVPTLHATEIKKDRNRWNNADVVESELEKTKRRIGIA